ncbi:hypothetical protein LOTGIDRAFT_171065 [Lottia gigantea]|uniref:Uncharacterized protein n=1 Tax=Lottia gigantea TaxID=225164 RepID=V4B1B8_LOTGI|nr:hypothetical protein LOTGIDRAFT_171065 [Lottia gigantea]ESP04093.1 hypothetical protein LOTGIDRAFT_171065 [Lottia gigantea]
MANKFGLGSLSLETKKPNTTVWINKAKPYFVDQIGDTLQVKRTFKRKNTDVKRFFKRQINNKDYIDDTKLQQEVTSLKNFIQQQLVNVVDKTQLQTLDNKITKQKIDLKQLIANINPGISEDKLQKELTNIQQQIQNIDEIKTYIHQQIQNIDDSVIQQQITTINNLVLKQDKNILALEKKVSQERIILFQSSIWKFERLRCFYY